MSKGARMPLFWRFMLLYLTVVSITALALFPLYGEAMRLARTGYLEESGYALQKSCDELERVTAAVYQITSTLRTSMDFQLLKVARAEALKPYSVNAMVRVKNMFTQLCYGLDVADDAFLYLTRNGLLFTGGNVYRSAGDYFDRSAVYMDRSAEALTRDFLAVDGCELWPSEAVFTVKAEPGGAAWVRKEYTLGMTLLVKKPNESAVVGARLDDARVLELFNMKQLPDNSFLRIEGRDGTPLFSHGSEADAYSVISGEIPLLGASVYVGIPDEYFTGLLAPMRRLLGGYILLAIALGAVMSAVCALMNYLPIRNLARKTRDGWAHGDEYARIGDMMTFSADEISRLREDIRRMEAGLRSNLLARMLSGLATTERERDELTRAMQPASSYRVALLRLYGAEDEPNAAVSYGVNHLLGERLDATMLLSQLDVASTAMLMNGNEAAFTLLADAANGAVAYAGLYGVAASVGVSDSFEELGAIYSAFRQAEHAAEEGASAADPVKRYAPPEGEPPARRLDVGDLQRLRQVLLSGDEDGAAAFVDMAWDALYGDPGTNDDDYRQTFYALRFVFDAALNGLPGARDGDTASEYRSEGADRFRSLSDAARRTARAVAACRDHPTRRMGETLERYARAHCDDPGLCAASIAEAFHVSESQIYKALRAATGKSVRDYIEQLRIERAARLLTQSEMPVSEIAQACGFNARNSFYRAFRRVYGVTPGDYRDNLRPDGADGT